MDEDLKKGLEALGKRKTHTIPVQVISVDKAKGTCKVSDGEIEDIVRLGSVIKDTDQRFYLFPAVGSQILIAPIEEDENRYHVVAISEVESLSLNIDKTTLKVDLNGIEINGSNFGGIVKAPELKTQLDKMTARIDGIINAINNGIPAAGASDGGSGLHASIKGSLASIVDNEGFGEIENETVKHGNG